MSDLRKIRVQHVSLDELGKEIREDVDVLTDADAVTMDGKKLIDGVKDLINGRVDELVNGAPKALDTLKELADELTSNKSNVQTIINKLDKKLDKNGDADGLFVANSGGGSIWSSGNRELKHWIDDFHKRTIENKDNIASNKGKIDEINANLPKYLLKSEQKTQLSQLVGDSNHRTVTDGEKSTWNNKVDKVSGKGLSTNDYDATAKKKIDNLTSTNSYNEATTSARGYMSANDKVKLNDCMRCKVLTQVQYDALSSTDKNRADTLYFIKK